MTQIDYPVKGSFDNGTDISRKVSYGDTASGDASKGGAKEFEPHPAKEEQHKTDTLKVTK
jgi:hypothetical protein